MPLINNDVNLIKKPKISKEALDCFLSLCKNRKFPKKGIIFRKSDPANSLYYVVEGSISVVVDDDEGNETVLAYLHAGDFIGEIGLFITGIERSAIVRARTECVLAEISYDRFNQLVKKELREHHAELLTIIGFQLSERLLKTSSRFSLLTSTDVSGRIARTLLDLCHEPEAMTHPEGTQIHISRQEIGRIVSCSRETVGRVLKQMRKDGMVEVKGMDIIVYHSR